ncbi:cysteine desulfurase mitochondrial-like [Senna tora]|uniref:Cysteine desulfurase mitochondrial-like n=1 Tax=Senna tora TaxID=362788 RepID=A0A834TF15_9FABA|nr:cysteine desulfurase mitochondrial-like [Senna tora]
MSSREEDEEVLVVYGEDEVINGRENDVFTVAGKIISSKPVNKGALENAFRNIWNQPEGLRVEEVDSNMFLFHFMNEKDMTRVIENGPWIFRNRWLTLARWRRGLVGTEEMFARVKVWVQLWGVPLQCRTEKIAKKLCMQLGEVHEVGLYEEQVTGCFYIRGLVSINVQNALRKGVNLGNVQDGVYWVDFRYERIPRCCYACGVFGHDESDCVMRKTAEEKGEVFVPKELGPWIKAERSGRRVVWPGSSNVTQNEAMGCEARRVGRVKKIDTEELINKLARMSVAESRDKVVEVETRDLTVKEKRVEAMLIDDGAEGNEVGVMRKEGEACGAHVGKMVNVVMERDERVDVSSSKSKVHDNPEALAGEKGRLIANETVTLNGTQVQGGDVGESKRGGGGKEMRNMKGSVKMWKRLARDKENLIPVVDVKKRLFNDLTNGGSVTEGSENQPLKKGMEVLKRGVVRLIGDGRGTRIFGDPWIPNLEGRTLQPRPGGLDDLSNVCVLLDETGRWRMELLNENFTEEEVAAIVRLPHNARRCGDRWTWRFTPHGGFTVKTAYHDIHSVNTRPIHETEFSELWKKIWKMKTLPSTKHFIWRAAKDILPTGDVLERRGMDIDGTCVLCGDENETGVHALLGCNMVQQCWSSSRLSFVNETDADIGFKEWINIAISQWAPKDLDLFAMEAQKIWERRNKARLGESVGCLNRLWVSVVEAWNELNGGKEVREEEISVEKQARWNPPTWRQLKLNVDASFKVGEANRTGCIVRDYRGRCLAALTKRHGIDGTVEIMEAQAVLDGLELARNLSIRDIIVEGDSSKVFNLLNGNRTDNTRDANKVAHILANGQVDFQDNSSSLVWLEDYPLLICNALRSDLLN